MKTVTYDENEWQLVPKISTSKMDGAGEDAYKDNGHCDCGNYDGCSMEEVYSAMLAVAPAAQDSAPAESPIKTWQERLREKFPETADRNLFAVGHLEHAMEAEIADLRAALAAAPASPQPVQRHIYDWLHLVETKIGTPTAASAARVLKDFYEGAEPDAQPVAKVLTDTQEAAFELAAKTIELFDDKTMENDYMLDSSECAGIIRALKPSAIAALAAASTPTTLTEKKE